MSKWENEETERQSWASVADLVWGCLEAPCGLSHTLVVRGLQHGPGFQAPRLGPARVSSLRSAAPTGEGGRFHSLGSLQTHPEILKC